MKTLGRNVVAAAALTAFALSALAIPAAHASTPPRHVKNGIITHKDGLSNYGACGIKVDPGVVAVASVPAEYWTTEKPSGDPLCRKMVRLTYKDTVYNFAIGGRCSGCAPNQLNLSQSAFQLIAGKSAPKKIKLAWEIKVPSRGESVSSVPGAAEAAVGEQVPGA